MKYLSLLIVLLLPLASPAVEPIFIEIGQNYDGHSNKELRRRVYQLERAVAQLQDQVFHLATRQQIAPVKQWTCQIQSFGKTHVATGDTRASAIAQVLKICSDATNAIHCKEDAAKCDNQ